MTAHAHVAGWVIELIILCFYTVSGVAGTVSMSVQPKGGQTDIVCESLGYRLVACLMHAQVIGDAGDAGHAACDLTRKLDFVVGGHVAFECHDTAFDKNGNAR